MKEYQDYAEMSLMSTNFAGTSTVKCSDYDKSLFKQDRRKELITLRSKIQTRGRGLGLCDSRQSPVGSFCKHGSETPCLIKLRNFFTS
jgi:hypothetical protein